MDTVQSSDIAGWLQTLYDRRYCLFLMSCAFHILNLGFENFIEITDASVAYGWGTLVFYVIVYW